MSIDILDILALEEGFRARPYICSEGYATIGYGLKLSRRKITERELHEYYDFELSEESCFEDLERKVSAIDMSLEKGNQLLSHVYREQDNYRRSALISMVYQLGEHGVGKFRKMLSAMLSRNYELAASEALDSLWAKQTPARADRLSTVIRDGDFLAYIKLIRD
jgi:GH24 family phage-related lysozyme (muramidase)